MSISDLNGALVNAERTLAHWEQIYPGIIRAEANAKVQYEVAWADAVTLITGRVVEGQKQPTVAVLEAEATRICADKIKAKRLAEAEAEIAKKLIGIAETTLTSIQTRASLERIEAGVSGYRT